MLEASRQNLGSLGARNVVFLEGDTAALPLESDSVDAAFANMVLHHAEDPAAMLAGMARVVKPGGAVAIADEVEHPLAWMREEHADVWRDFSKGQVEGFFREAELTGFGYKSLGIQRCIKSPTSGEVADIKVFAAWRTVPASVPADPNPRRRKTLAATHRGPRMPVGFLTDE